MDDVEQEPQDQRARDIEAMGACVKHARDLLDSACAVFDIKHPNIAFHLALLSLEELGRRKLIGLQGVAAGQPTVPPWMQKHTLEHQKKLFWCFFGPILFADEITKERLEGITELANRLHTERLSALYVGYSGDDLNIPSETISAEYCAAVIDAAAAQLALAQAEVPRIPTEEELQTQRWFLAISEDPEARRFVYSQGSFAKLNELRDARAWVLWLKEQFDRVAAESRKQMEQEIERSRAVPEKGTKNKWKVRIRITSQSHSIRQKTLNIFNERIDWIKLTAVQGKPNEMIVEFIFKDNVPVGGLWYFGWGIARYFVAALNIATMGFWWWHLPEDIDSYYESVEDVDTKARVEITRTPSLRVDWGGHRVLSEDDMNRAALCFVSFPPPFDREKHKPYDYYTAGLTFLSLNDVHWQCEMQAFGNFFESLRALMERFGDLQPGEPYLPVLDKIITEMIPELHKADKLMEILPAFDKRDPSGVIVTLSEVAMMKILCDTYYQHRVFREAVREAVVHPERPN
jgi:AbiV family abortive infection protein